MSRTRMISLVAGLLLALLGIIGLVAYVSAAEERAASGEQRVEVWVADRRIPPGTGADRIDSFASVVDVPEKLTTSASVGDLIDLDGLVLADEILEGEVISVLRFTSPTEFARDADRLIELPDGLHELTLSLSPERAGGGLLQPGDFVGIVATAGPVTVDGDLPIEIDGEIWTPGSVSWATSKMTLVDALVTNIQLEEVPEVVERAGLGDEESVEVRLVPSGNLLVTLAVDPVDAERVVWVAEYGNMWMTVQNGLSIGESVGQNRERISLERDDLIDDFGSNPIDSSSGRDDYLERVALSGDGVVDLGLPSANDGADNGTDG